MQKIPAIRRNGSLYLINFMSNVLKNLLNYIEEPALIFEEKSNSLHQNNAFLGKFFGFNPENWQEEIKKLEYKLNFDICLLESENLTTYTPIRALIQSKIDFSTFVEYQKNQRETRYFIVKTAKLGARKIIYFHDITEKLALERLEGETKKLEAEIELLKEQVKTTPAAQNQAVKMALLNRVSNSLRAPSLNTPGIIEVAKAELKTIFRSKKVDFVSGSDIEKFGDIDAVKNGEINFSVTLKEHKKSKEHFKTPTGRIIMPILPHGIFAIFTSKKELNESERELLEGVTNQIFTAIELKETQLQLINSEKMASLGQLIANVAHEINTPLASISANNEIMEKLFKTTKMADNSELLDNMNTIDKEAIKRIANLVKSLKRFVRLDETEQQEADINAELDLTLELLRHKTKNSIEIVKNYGSLPMVNCYPNMLNQVFLNILSNSIDAIKDMQGKGKVVITTALDGDYLIIKMEDNGCGIEKDCVSKIFDPGYTTKKIGEGTGLGLAICKKIIDKHGGTIDFTSSTGKTSGTEFIIKIPVSMC